MFILTRELLRLLRCLHSIVGHFFVVRAPHPERDRDRDQKGNQTESSSDSSHKRASTILILSNSRRPATKTNRKVRSSPSFERITRSLTEPSGGCIIPLCLVHLPPAVIGRGA